MTRNRRAKLTRRQLLRLVLVLVALGVLSSCSPYGRVSVGVPFKMGPVYVHPSIGIGGYL